MGMANDGLSYWQADTEGIELLDTTLGDLLDSRAGEILESKILTVSERLDQTDQRLAHLATLENSISQLFDSLEENRNAAREIAEDAAGRMAEHLIRTYPQFAQGAQPAGPSPELVALEQGL